MSQARDLGPGAVGGALEYKHRTDHRGAADFTGLRCTNRQARRAAVHRQGQTKQLWGGNANIGGHAKTLRLAPHRGTAVAAAGESMGIALHVAAFKIQR